MRFKLQRPCCTGTFFFLSRTLCGSWHSELQLDFFTTSICMDKWHQAFLSPDHQSHRRYMFYLRTGIFPGVKFFLPLLRRAAITLRPPGVAIRARKPETRARLRRVPYKVAPKPFFLFASTKRGRRIPEAARRTGSKTISAKQGRTGDVHQPPMN